MSERDIEDEFVYQNSIRLNNQYLRLAGRQAGVRDVARAEPDDRQDRRIRRGGGAVLSHVGHAGPRLDRPPALPDQGPRVASRRGASVHRAERGPGPQRRLRQLPFGLRVPGRAEHLPAVPHRHRGLGPAVRSLEPRLPLSDRVHHRGPGADHGTRLRPSAGREAARSTGRSRRRTSTPRPTGRGSSSSPAAWPRPRSSNCWASPTRPCCGRRCSRCRRARCRSG